MALAAPYADHLHLAAHR